MTIWYMNGAGNDFMVIDARGQEIDFESLSKKLCGESGADGFMAVDFSKIADFKLHFYNADGTRGEMCGNGARCICRFAYDNHIAAEEMTIETDAGIVYGKRLSESQYVVKLNNPGMLDLYRKEDIAYVELGNPGVPHAVKEIQDLTWEMRGELFDLGRGLRYDSAFPKGANVNFYTWMNEDEIRILTYERGVEDYTLACGTGSASTAIVLWLKGEMKGNHLTVHNPGGILEVTIEGQDGVVESVYLEGPTEVVRIMKRQLKELLLKRRSIRRYTDETIPREILEQIVEAGLLAPSGRNRQPWEFVVVEDKDVLALLAKAREHGASMLEGAAAAIVVFADPALTDVWTEDASIAMTVMHLMATELGVGSCWIQGRLRYADSETTTEDYIKKLLGVPEEYKLEAMLSLGMPDEEKAPHTEEELKREKVHWGRF